MRIGTDTSGLLFTRVASSLFTHSVCLTHNTCLLALLQVSYQKPLYSRWWLPKPNLSETGFQLFLIPVLDVRCAQAVNY